MSKDDLIALLHAISGAGVLIVSFLTRDSFLGLAAFLKPFGFVVFVMGMFFFTFSVFFLKEAFRGNVRPVTEKLIREGPYRWIRHPLYLSMLISIIGLAVGMRSLWGLTITFIMFFPFTIMRAKLEEAALHDKFGKEWEEYLEQTDFLLPLIY